MVFQNYALYPHMTVEKNIGYGLKNMKMPADQIKKKVDWAIDILGLQEFQLQKTEESFWWTETEGCTWSCHRKKSESIPDG